MLCCSMARLLTVPHWVTLRWPTKMVFIGKPTLLAMTPSNSFTVAPKVKHPSIVLPHLEQPGQSRL